MAKKLLIALFMLALVLIGYGVYEFFRPSDEIVIFGSAKEAPKGDAGGGKKTLEEKIEEAKSRSSNIKGLYMTAAVANDRGAAATRIRNNIVSIVEKTEVNGLVIDVKETGGPEVTKNLKPFLDEMKAKDIWTIARIATFRDNSKVETHPEYYLKRSDGRIWRDNKGNAWLDPMHAGARLYILNFAKEISDLGFDELQFDYIRFPSDGNTSDIVYPAYNKVTTPKHVAMRDFFEFLHKNLKDSRPEIILSVDFFGYVAIEKNDLGIGQRLEDVGAFFDYISPMVYPSHFYSGFYVKADPLRGLPTVSLPYKGKDISVLVSARPYDVILRSLYTAGDILSGRDAQATTSTSTSASVEDSDRRIKILRPWLQDFDLGVDTTRGIFYDTKAVRAQIDAAEKAGASGWLLWSPTNTYTEGALKAN